MTKECPNRNDELLPVRGYFRHWDFIRHSSLVIRHSPACVLLVLATTTALAQYTVLEEPQQTLTLPRLQYVRMDVEAERTSQDSKLGVQTEYQRLYVAPSVGIRWDYFIYHPDLLNFSLLAEPGYSFQETGPPDAMSRRDEFLINGTLNVKLLQLKPYATTIFASAIHNTHQYDFFNTVVEDTRSYGFISGYRDGPVPVTISFADTRRDTSGFSYDTSSDQINVDLHARNERRHEDFTDFSYQFSQYDSTSSGAEAFSDSTTFHYVTLTDTEHFNRFTLNSTLLFDKTEAVLSSSDDLSVLLNGLLEHTPRLHTLYDYSFFRFGTEGGDSIQNRARMGVMHQLYESLSSSADIHGTTLNSSFNGSTLDLVSGGATAGVGYTKRLGSWGRLSLSDTVSYDYTDQSASGSEILISKESHALPTGQWVRLTQPRVIAITSVTTDAAHGEIPLTENVDYFVDRTRDPWQLQRNPFSIILTDSNNIVLVTYTAQANPSGSYSTLGNQAQIRLDLWHGLLGLYARYGFSDNQAYSPGFVLENYSDFQAGSDLYYRGLRLNANYTDRESSLFSYYSYNLSEGYARSIGSYSTFGVDFSQRWTYYPENGNSQGRSYRVTFYDFILRYAWHPITTIDWSAEAGYQRQRGNGLDQDLFVARTYLNWLIGKLNLHLGYEYQNQEYISDTRERHFIFLRARRSF